VQLVWHERKAGKTEAFREEFRIKRLNKHEKERLVASGPRVGLEHANPVGGGIVMTKTELVGKLAEETDVAKKVAAGLLNSLVKIVQEALKKEGKIRIDCLGTFVVVDRKARTGVNPRTRAKIKIPATKAPAFRAAKGLKDAVKEVHKKAGKKAK
jgi:DNA-binding protein HU-beta